jgi:hypothetical protein
VVQFAVVGLTLAVSVRNGASIRHTGEGRCPDTSVVEAVLGLTASSNPRVEML